MIRVVEQRNVIGPVFPGKGIEPLHLRIEIIIDEQAERRRNHERIVDRHGFRVRLADQQNIGATLAAEEPLEGGALDRLILEHLPRIFMSRWCNHQQGCDRPSDHPGAEIRFGMGQVLT